MIYKDLTKAFLFEAILGFVALVVFITLGKLGWLILALMALRPVTLETVKAQPDASIYRIYYQAMRLSVFFAGSAIVLTVIAFQFQPFTLYDRTLVINLIIPWFMLGHGFIGYFLSRGKQTSNPNAS